MSETTLRERMASLAKDRRGWIPFAVLGVLLLLLSTALIVSLETREDPEPDIDEQLAYDRGEASAQAALRTAVRDAATEAGDAPVTSVNTSDGQLEALREVDKEEFVEKAQDGICDQLPPSLQDSCDPDEIGDDIEFDELPENLQQNHVFRNYVRLLVFEHAGEQFDGASQEIRDTTTEVELQEADDHEERIERVDLNIGYQDDNDLQEGMLGASIEDVDLRVTQDGELVDERTLDRLDVTVGTTLFELHDRTQTYEQHLQMGFFEGLGESDGVLDFPGLGQKYALRLYPVAYGKSAIKSRTNPETFPTFEDVVSHRQSEVLANHAIYSVQEDVFGVNDPHSSTEMRIGAVCLALDFISEPVSDAFDEPIKDYLNSTFEAPWNESVQNITSSISIDDNVTDDVNEGLKDTLGEGIAGNISEIVVDSIQGGFNDTVEEANRTATDPAEWYDIVFDTEAIFDGACEALQNSYGDGAGDAEDQLPAFSDVIAGISPDDGEDMVPGDQNLYINNSAALAYQEVVKEEIDPDDEDDPEDWEDELNLGDWTAVDMDFDDEGVEEIEEEYGDPMQDFYEHLGDLEETEVDAEATSPRDAIETAYTVQADEEIDDEDPDFSPGEPGEPSGSPENGSWVKDGDPSESVEIESTSVDITDESYDDLDTQPDRTETFFEVELTVEQEKTVTQDWECEPDDPENETCSETAETSASDLGTASAEITVEGEYAPGLDIEHADDRPLDSAYTDGGTVGPVSNNFDGMPEDILLDRFDVGDLDEDALEGELEALSGEVDGEDLEDAVYSPTGDTDNYCAIDVDSDDCRVVDATDDDVDTLESWLENELASMLFGTTDPDDIESPEGHPGGLLNLGEDPTVDPIEVDVQEYIEGIEGDLLHNFTSHVGEIKDDIIYQDIEGDGNHNYENVPDMARAQLYYEYIERLNESVETSEEVRKKTFGLDEDDGGLISGVVDRVTSGAKSLLGSAASTAKDTITSLLGSAMSFAEDALGGAFDEGTDEEAGELNSSLYENVTFEVHGSPTYLSLSEDDREDTAAVRPTDDGRFGGHGGFDPGAPLNESLSGMPGPAPDNEHSTFYAGYANGAPYPGLPIIPLPGLYVAQASFWMSQIGGEYPRFEVSATTGDPAATTSYVRETQVVETEVGGDEVRLGEVEPIEFNSDTFLAVVLGASMPVGEGTPSTWAKPEDLANAFFGCSDTYPVTGPEYEGMDEYEELKEYLEENVPGGAAAISVIENIDGPIGDINDKIPFIDPLPEIEDHIPDEEIVCAGHQLNELLGGLINGDD